MTEEVELEPIEKEPDIHEQILDQMQEYAKADIENRDLYIIVTPSQKERLGKHMIYTTDQDYFMDAKVIQHWKTLPSMPMVIPKTVVRRILSDSL